MHHLSNPLTMVSVSPSLSYLILSFLDFYSPNPTSIGAPSPHTYAILAMFTIAQFDHNNTSATVKTLWVRNSIIRFLYLLIYENVVSVLCSQIVRKVWMPGNSLKQMFRGLVHFIGIAQLPPLQHSSSVCSPPSRCPPIIIVAYPPPHPHQYATCQQLQQQN